MRAISIVSVAMALALPSGVAAQSNVRPAVPARAPGAIVKSVTEADLKALVLAEGHTVEKVHPLDEPSVRGKTKDGLKFILIGTACDKSGVAGCQGIMMQVRYDSDDEVTTEKVNAANLKEAAISTWWDKSSKTFGFTRYVVLDDGVTWMNVRRNLQVLLSIEPVALKAIWPD